jgi:glycosyltransferase involved in cell wall biosynthesis
MTSKYKILTISDHPLVSSGVGSQTRYIIEGLLKTGKYTVRSLGAAIKHEDYRVQKITDYGDDWLIFPINGYGDENMMREILDVEKPDVVWFMTDPRFFGWLYNMSDEIRERGIPLLYYHVWDNYPVPAFNKNFYQSCDYVGCISKLTHDILCNLGMADRSDYIPHAVNQDIFKPLSEEEISKLRSEKLTPHKDKFIVFYNSRNARRKMTSDIVKTFKMFLSEVGEDKAFLLMHTDPHDQEGANLLEVVKLLNLSPSQIAFSNQRLPPDELAAMYNMADVTINISNNEGFGLSCLESLCCGTPVIVNRTGGLQDQAEDDEGNQYGIVIDPATTSLTGSQEIPYIIDDRCADGDVVEAFLKMYRMTPEERRALGLAARVWTEKRFRMEDMVGMWQAVIEKYINQFKTHGYCDRVKLIKV